MAALPTAEIDRGRLGFTAMVTVSDGFPRRHRIPPFDAPGKARIRLTNTFILTNDSIF
jgi:hypothetical protein